MHSIRVSISCAGLLLLVGCGSDVGKQVQQTAQQVTQKVTDAVDNAQTKAKEQLQLAGKAELTLNGPLNTPACYAVFTPAIGERGSVLMFTSYRDVGKEVFPSFLVEATFTQAKLSQVVGQTVPARMFVKPTVDGPTWHTPFGETVQLKIVSATTDELTAEVVGGSLASTDGDASQAASAKFVAVFPK